MFEIRVLQRVKADLEGLADDVFDRLARDIDSLAFAPRREDAEELGDGYWLLKPGPYAVIYAIDDARSVVLVVRVGTQDQILSEGS